MPQKASTRDYKKEYARDHASPTQRKHRSMRNKGRRLKGLKKGDGKEVDHKTPLSKGGGNTKSNLRVTSRKANRSKGTKVIKSKTSR